MRVLVVGAGPAGATAAIRARELGADITRTASSSRSAAARLRVVATAMAAGMSVAQLAETRFAFPAFTEAVSMAAQKACRTIGIGQFPPAWSYLGSGE